MSQNIRQNNLFAAEDFTKIYKSFQQVDFKAYDLNSIQQSLIDNIRLNYPENFNDYINSSEFIAHIKLLSYIASSLAFRADLNASENVLDTAERRESIIRLAKMVNYYPSRNKPLTGVAKIIAIQTNEPLTDSVGNTIQNKTVFWDDPNNKDSYDQFITIMNSALSVNNPFGKPYKKKTINGVQNSIYQLSNLKNYEVAYKFSSYVEGKPMPFDVCNVDVDDNGVLFEKHPDPIEAFNLLYRTDGQGQSSPNTGFFVYFKQGTLLKKDYIFELPIKNRTTEIDIENVNETDVYVQEINQNGEVLNKWTKIDNVNGGNNLIYNAVNLNNRNIYSVSSGLNDKITLNFTDGNFGNVPTGIFRTWVRASANRNVSITPEQMQQIQIKIPYVNVEGKTFTLTISFSLQYTVNNAATTETIQQVKQRAPQAYYSQNRMVNNEDYNVYPLVKGNEIIKVRTVNRTHAGHSRYIDINDPTGFHENVLAFADDGAIYVDKTVPSSTIEVDNAIEENTENVIYDIQQFLKNKELANFYYEIILSQYKIYKQNTYASGDIYNKYNVFEFISNENYDSLSFIPEPEGKYNNTGYLRYVSSGVNYDFYGNTDAHTDGESDSTTYGRTRFLKVGSKLKFANENQHVYVTVKSIYTDINNQSVFVLDKIVQKDWALKEIYPTLDVTFNETEKDIISSNMKLKNDFSLYYDVDDVNSPWKVRNTYDENAIYQYKTSGKDWVFVAQFKQNLTNNKHGYKVFSRGLEYIFESYKDVRFYFDSEQYDYDRVTGKAKKDTIEITTQNTTPSLIERWGYDGTKWSVVGGASADSGYHGNYIPLLSRDSNADNVIATTIEGTSVVKLSNGVAVIDNTSAGDVIQLEYSENIGYISEPVILDVHKNVYQEDGYLDQSKVIVVPHDGDDDGIPDDMFGFVNTVSRNDLVFIEEKPDIDGYISKRLWKTTWMNYLGSPQDKITFTISDLSKTFLFLVDEVNIKFLENAITETIIRYILESDAINSTQLNLSVGNTVIYVKIVRNGSLVYENSDDFTVMEKISIDNTILTRLLTTNNLYKSVNAGYTLDVQAVMADVNLNPVSFIQDDDHYVKNGRSVSLNLLDQNEKLYYKWSHYAPYDNRVDPSISNIMDMIILTNSYYKEVLIWKGKKNTAIPTPPTSEELRLQFNDFNNFKMQSDQIIFQSAKFKLLFGGETSSKLQAKFKVVKTSNASISDNEVKTKVIEAIDIFFNVANWDFGESFYYTELAAFIHRYLAKYLASVVIVPMDKEAKFGDLFQIKSEPNELFLSTATVDNVEIVTSLTENNMRA